MSIDNSGYLKSINLEKFRLHAFPVSLLEFSKIDKIYLADNNIRILPDNILNKNLPIHWGKFENNSDDGKFIMN